jgi:hypothetical protein
MKKIIILKNDRTGDLFVSLGTINKIITKHKRDKKIIFLSNINHKFSFLFPEVIKKIIPMNLGLFQKIFFLFYLFRTKVDTVYILTPKNFYYYLPFIFRKIKFYAITIKAKKSRPNNFLLKYLYNFVVIDRLNLKKRKSSYITQKELIQLDPKDENLNNLSIEHTVKHNFEYPQKFIFFHYKHNLFKGLLNWELDKIINLLNFFSETKYHVLFSSEIFNEKINNYFSKQFNTYDYNTYKRSIINKKKIIFLKDVDGYNLFDAVNKSSKVICPEGIISHMSYFLNKPLLALIHFKLKNRQEFKDQLISCKEWFPPKNYKYTILKKDFLQSMKKIKARIEL